MNAPFLTQGADGLPRRGFTNAEVARMVEVGLINPEERIELIRGEIVPMAPEMDRHFRARARLVRIFNLALGEEFIVGTEGSLFLADDLEFQPDLHVFSAALKSHDVRGPDVLIAVELSSTTQKRDLDVKAPLYGAHGVRELWVIDLEARTGLIFDSIVNGAYAPGRPIGEDDALSPAALPKVSLRIADLY